MVQTWASRWRQLAPPPVFRTPFRATGLALRLTGPAFAVSIGYMDPGNWATDLASAQFGYRLLWTIVLASVIAIVLQLAVTHLVYATGRDLATLIADRWPHGRLPLQLVYQLSIIATDLAEFTGIVFGLALLLNLPIVVCVTLGLTGVLGLLALRKRSSHVLTKICLIAVLGIGIFFAHQLMAVSPDMQAIVGGMVVPSIPNAAAFAIVVGTIGATVMPHNLFLHSSLVAERLTKESIPERFYITETIVALTLAAGINAAILIASVPMHFGALGSLSRTFGAALLVCGATSSAMATLTGDFIAQGFKWGRFFPLLRRSISLAPAAAALIVGIPAFALLFWSQVALAFFLPAVLIPMLVLLYGSRQRRALWLLRSATAVATCCLVFDIVTIYQLFR